MIVAMASKPKPKPLYAHVLEERREALGKTKEDLLRETDDALSRQFLHRVLTGETNPEDLSYKKLAMLAAYYEWDFETLARALGIGQHLGKFLMERKSLEGITIVKVYYALSMASDNKIPTGSTIAINNDTLHAIQANGYTFECYAIDSSVWVSFAVTEMHGFRAGDTFGIAAGSSPDSNEQVVALRDTKNDVVYLCRSDELDRRVPYYIGGKAEQPDMAKVETTDKNLVMGGIVKHKSGVL